MKYILTIELDAASSNIIGIKEDLGMYCEKYGDMKLLTVKEKNKVVHREHHNVIKEK